jgi:hypothetical protein
MEVAVTMLLWRQVAIHHATLQLTNVVAFDITLQHIPRVLEPKIQPPEYEWLFNYITELYRSFR